jgi:hypothetical protein
VQACQAESMEIFWNRAHHNRTVRESALPVSYGQLHVLMSDPPPYLDVHQIRKSIIQQAYVLAPTLSRHGAQPDNARSSRLHEFQQKCGKCIGDGQHRLMAGWHCTIAHRGYFRRLYVAGWIGTSTGDGMCSGCFQLTESAGQGLARI